jgi:hypothetical protein
MTNSLKWWGEFVMVLLRFCWPGLIFFALCLGLLTLLIFMVACATKCLDAAFDYPAGMSSMCVSEREAAKACIDRVAGSDVGATRSCTVATVPGEKKFGNGWGWWSEAHNSYVCGLAGRRGACDYLIQIGVDPQRGGDVNRGSLRHEWGHYWIDCNDLTDGQSHNPRFSSCFASWRDAAQKPMTFLRSDGNIENVDYPTEE